MIIKNCGRKFKMIERSFHFIPTYVQPDAPTNCKILFQGVNPKT